MRKRVLARIFKVRFHWRKHKNKLVSIALHRISASVITKIRERKYAFPYGNIQKSGPVPSYPQPQKHE